MNYNYNTVRIKYELSIDSPPQKVFIVVVNYTVIDHSVTMSSMLAPVVPIAFVWLVIKS